MTTIEYTEKRRYVIRSKKLKRGEMHFPKWYSSRCVASTKNRRLEIMPDGGFKSSSTFFRNGEEAGKLALSWTGRVTLTLETPDGECRKFQLKTIGMFRTAYVLVDENDHEIANVDYAINWRKLAYDYTVEPLIVSDPEDEDWTELVIFVGYAMRAIQQRQAASVS